MFCWTQRKIFWRKFVTRLFWGTIDFHSRKKNYYGSQWCPRTALFPTFFKISSFVFSRTKTFIRVWNYLRVSKWQNFHFWVNYPLIGYLAVTEEASLSPFLLFEHSSSVKQPNFGFNTQSFLLQEVKAFILQLMHFVPDRKLDFCLFKIIHFTR